MHGGSMDRQPTRKWASVGKLIAAHEFCLWLIWLKKSNKAYAQHQTASPNDIAAFDLNFFATKVTPTVLAAR